LGAAEHRGLESRLTALMIVLTTIASFLFAYDMLRLAAAYRAEGDLPRLARLLAFVATVLVLIHGNLVYQVARLGHVLRRQRHRPRPVAEAAVPGDAPSLAILVPSYKEDLRTIRQTLLSAALQDYPNRRVVLLLDDPPRPSGAEDAARLAAARRVPAEVAALLDEPARPVRLAAARFFARTARGPFDPSQELASLLDIYAQLVDWFARQAEDARRGDHVDALFAEVTFGARRAVLQERARRLTGRDLTVREAREEYLWLHGLFRVELTSFERKRYPNLAHEPNKAANLNSYLGLLGKRVRERRNSGGLHLEISEADRGPTAGILVPDAKYVITLDADSLLSPEYACRLVAVMEEPGNERLAVVQTPYTAVPHAPGVLERIAGATTDMQYVVHQGFTWCRATFWVGANALLRKAALEDIQTVEIERGFPVAKFIQDRTVIEDTESTVDLVARGWTLHNYPERLAYSATPPDFGSLLIQRRRWVNGGLLVVPNLVRYLLARPLDAVTPLEALMRLHYLASIAMGSLGLLVLLVLPVDEDLLSIWLPVIAAPYFLLYWRDLLLAGYRKSDVLRVYAFNVMLLPINLAGVGKSLQQAATGEKIPFGRTPKVAGRTAAPAWAVMAEYLLLAYCLGAVVWDVLAGRWFHALFSLGTAAAQGYAVMAFLGLRASREDLLPAWHRLSRR
jgi:cellulose synthase/poly-beta-1,6-N-acetylglucosamine synthase-like glycosyltransferase